MDSNSKDLAKMAFNSAFKTSLKKPISEHQSGNSEDPIAQLINQFELASQKDEDGVEFWMARELQKLLGYSEYRNFSVTAISRAIEACRLSGQPVENHFVDVNEMVEIGSGAGREITDYKLTRYACYLIAQNGDSRKKQIAFAQTYFAIQTRKLEIQADAQQYAPLSEDHKRLLLRDEIKSHNKNLASAAKGAGVISPLDFALFQNFGYKGLYGGLDNKGIQKRKKLTPRESILDHMGSTELAANLFRATQAEDKLRRDQTAGKDRANHLHMDVGRRVRQTIRELGGTMPENLPPAENIEKVAKLLKKASRRELPGETE